MMKTWLGQAQATASITIRQKIRLGRLRSLDAGQGSYFSLRCSYVGAERGGIASDPAGPPILGIHVVVGPSFRRKCGMRKRRWSMGAPD